MWTALRWYSYSILIEVWWASWSGLIIHWHSARRKLWKSVSDLVVSNEPLVLNIFLAISEVILLFLNSHNITCEICTFSSSIWSAWNHRLNDDIHSESEWPMKVLFNQIMFGCVWSTKFKVRSYQLDLKNKNYLRLNLIIAPISSLAVTTCFRFVYKQNLV